MANDILISYIGSGAPGALEEDVGVTADNFCENISSEVGEADSVPVCEKTDQSLPGSA